MRSSVPLRSPAGAALLAGARARISRRSAGLRAPRIRHPRLWALGLYLILALLTVGWRAIRDPTRVCACSVNTDPSAYMWALKWWPYAILHGLNPFVSHYVWAPTGANLARSAMIPTAALAMTPVTELFGPVASYNALLVLIAVLAAFTGYLLCRRIVGRELPALAGGYLFGFGAFELAQLINHPNISLIFLVPVMVHLALRRADREISARRYIVALGIVFAAQAGLSSEILATAVALGLVALLIARLLAPEEYRARVRRLLGETIAAGGVAVAVASPFLYYALVKGGSQHEWPLSDAYGLDLLNPFFPTQVTWLGSHAFQALGSTFEQANPPEADGYLSLPVILAFAFWYARTRRRFLARMLLIMASVSLVAALGSHLKVAGIQTVELPFNWVKNQPVFRLLTPGRIALYISLAFAIAMAAWLAESPPRSARRVRRWLVFALAAVMVFPNIASGLWGGTQPNPAFFRNGSYRRYLSAGETVLVMPYGWNSDSMLWQAETNFYFRMPEGYLGHIPPAPFEGSPAVGQLYSNNAVEPQLLIRFLKSSDVRAIVIDPGAGVPLVPFIAELADYGLHPLSVGGVLLYRLPATGL